MRKRFYNIFLSDLKISFYETWTLLTFFLRQKGLVRRSTKNYFLRNTRDTISCIFRQKGPEESWSFQLALQILHGRKKRFNLFLLSMIHLKIICFEKFVLSPLTKKIFPSCYRCVSMGFNIFERLNYYHFFLSMNTSISALTTRETIPLI